LADSLLFETEHKPEKAAAPYGVQRLSLEENEELLG